ncbi:MAG: acyl carrier protein [Acidobacteriia bacterium]|nr:acyl carrier protein [Terriglobia bacterium]
MNTSSDKIREQLRAYIMSEVLPGERPENLKDDMSLQSSGVLDSMATLRLVSFIEQRFGIEVEAHEAGIENLEFIDAITAFVQRKQRANGVKP